MHPLAKWTVPAVVAVLLVGTVLSLGVAPDDRAAAEADIDPDRTFIQIRLHEDGSATWEVEYTYRLESEDESAAFEDLQADIRANRSAYRSSFRDTLAGSVDRAESETGRAMEMRDVSVSTRRQGVSDTGIVTYAFVWTNFSRVSEDTIEAGDAIRGFFVDEGTLLEVKWPDGYRLASIDPEADRTGDTTAAWQGPTNFGSTEPVVRLERRPNGTETPAQATTVPPTTAGGGDGGSDGTPRSESEDGLPATPLAAVGLLTVVMVGALGWAYARSVEGADGDEEPLPEELLSPEERVLRALDERGGRMKQKALREQLDWTAPKTSKVLGELKDEDAVEVFRLGRENVVTLPDTGLEDETDA